MFSQPTGKDLHVVEPQSREYYCNYLNLRVQVIVPDYFLSPIWSLEIEFEVESKNVKAQSQIRFPVKRPSENHKPFLT